MAPIKSSLARTLGKLLGVSKDTDLSLRGDVQSTRFIAPPFEATGGTKIPSGSNIYHVFTTNQNFEVTSGTNNIELLVVGGGGGTAESYAGGGGGGGVAYGPSVPVSTGTYAVTVGAGGAWTSSKGDASSPGGTSSIVLPAGTIRGLGGGTGLIDAYQTGPAQYNPGGSGGGNGDDDSPNAGDATQPGEPNFGVGIVHYGNPGYGPGSGNASASNADGGGGGGAGEGGGSGHTDRRAGGAGQPFSNFPAPVIEPAIPAPVRPAWTPTVGPTGIFAGGGTGALGPSDRVPGGGGGGETDCDAVDFTGGGGGGNNAGAGGSGGNGIVIIKYTA